MTDFSTTTVVNLTSFPTPTVNLPSIFGPLTTDFTAPSSCYNLPVQCLDGQCGWLEPFRTCGFDGLPTPAPECYPSGNEEEGLGFSDWESQSKQLVYAPATGCPGGWESMQGTRTVECCPSGFTLATPTESEYAGQTSCNSDITYSQSNIIATVCPTGTDSSPFLTTFVAETSLDVVWAKRILVVPDAVESTTDSSSSVRSTRTTAGRSSVTEAQETSRVTEAGGVTSRLPNASATGNTGGKVSVNGGVLEMVLGAIAVMLVVV